MPPVESKRLFFAIELPSFVKTRLAEIQKELKTTGADVKWVETENIHITLKFLGNVGIDQIKDLNETLNKEFCLEKIFPTQLDRLGCFPSQRSPRVVWAGFKDQDDHLQNIADRLDRGISTLGFQKETRKFQSHATLGRIRSMRNTIALSAKIEEYNNDSKPLDLTIDNITLFESLLSPKGPTYSVIHQVKFK